MTDIRRLIDIASTITENAVEEAYSNEQGYFKRYMQGNEFDPYAAWYEVANWIERNDFLDDVKATDGTSFSSADELQSEGEPDLFYQLPEAAQKECAEEVTEWLMRHNPGEAPTTAHMSLDDNAKPLHRSTWLVHFSNRAHQIWRNGFLYGAEDMTQLGLTTYASDKYRMSAPGFNFAFRALSRDADKAESAGKYGSEAVLFQSSGVEAYHYGDEENQVVFWGPSVDKREIIFLDKEDGEWQVKSSRPLRNGGDTLFTGEFEDAVKWAIKHHQQYRGYLYQRK